MGRNHQGGREVISEGSRRLSLVVDRSLVFIYFNKFMLSFFINDVILVYLTCFRHLIKFISSYFGGGFVEGSHFS